MHHNNNNNTVQTENTEAHGVKGMIAKVKAVLPGHKESPATTAQHMQHTTNATAAAGPHIGATGPHHTHPDNSTTHYENTNAMLPGNSTAHAHHDTTTSMLPGNSTHHTHHDPNAMIPGNSTLPMQHNTAEHNIVPGTAGKIGQTKVPATKGMFPNTTAAHLADAQAANAEFARTHGGNATHGVMDHGELRYGENIVGHHQGDHTHSDVAGVHQQQHYNNNHHHHDATAAAAAGTAAAATAHHHNHDHNLAHPNTTTANTGIATKISNMMHHKQGVTGQQLPYTENHVAPNAEFNTHHTHHPDPAIAAAQAATGRGATNQQMPFMN
ncbi:hypothetical protein HDU86_005815 [Geranomyces michiganensis]|nr:hypothetical protein HDU86_005815 [Geranomyces michiganensis]